MRDSDLNAALAEWKTALGEENVTADASATLPAQTATFSTRQRVLAILKPAHRAEVQDCLRIANFHGIPVYPVSRGKNWGYGSRVPTAPEAVLLDLCRLNRIVDFDEKLAYVTLEPGVTQGQLYAFLAERKSGLWMDATGSSNEASVVGNALERGFGHTPYGERFSHLCGLEAVLPNGEVLETGFHRFPGAKAAPTYPFGMGPYIDGLFTQSNFGVVTRMTLWLMPAPEYFQSFFFRSDNPGGLAPLVEAVRPLRLNGTIRNTIHIANDYKVLSGLRQYPFEETGGQTPLAPERMAEFRRRLHFGSWNGSGGLYGTRRQVAEARRLLRRALKGKIDRIGFIDDRMLALIGRFATPFRLLTGWDLSRTLAILRPVFGLMKGIPTDQPMESAYWRKRTVPPPQMDPDRDRCGLLWYAPVAPATGQDAVALTDATCEVALAHGFEPAISMTMVTERSLTCVISITYDRDVAGDDDAALRCLNALRTRLSTLGYYSYRLGVQSMVEMQGQNTYNRVLDSFRKTLDPKGILAPGRYSAR
ncbi:MAG: FAD-dependent oxidoreductase [Acidobacteria bacterium]|nr:FAD-dependent oxidoreductase [Acidobacteriota bacterium]